MYIVYIVKGHRISLNFWILFLCLHRNFINLSFPSIEHFCTYVQLLWTKTTYISCFNTVAPFANVMLVFTKNPYNLRNPLALLKGHLYVFYFYQHLALSYTLWQPLKLKQWQLFTHTHAHYEITLKWRYIITIFGKLWSCSGCQTNSKPDFII